MQNVNIQLLGKIDKLRFYTNQVIISSEISQRCLISSQINHSIVPGIYQLKVTGMFENGKSSLPKFDKQEKNMIWDYIPSSSFLTPS